MLINRSFKFIFAMYVLLTTIIPKSSAIAQKGMSGYKPVIGSGWWNITGQPDLGAYTSDHQEPVDFAVWKAADGTWQLWSCVRGTKIGGNTRLFFRWEGKSLQDTAWKPMGIAMTADTSLGETAGGLQAPYVFKEKGVFQMVYGDWKHICRATSRDGKKFARVINADHTTAIFSGPLYNTRDPMILKVQDTYYCYYCAHNEKDDRSGGAQSAVFCRTSKDLESWSAPVTVVSGGRPIKETPWYGGDSECPFVVEWHGKFILFRNQRYGQDNFNTQYCSSDPLNFGRGTDDMLVGELPVAAPEIVRDGDQYYIVSLRPDLKGMRVAKMRFERL